MSILKPTSKQSGLCFFITVFPALNKQFPNWKNDMALSASVSGGKQKTKMSVAHCILLQFMTISTLGSIENQKTLI